ncbi:MAG: hypothetical protein ABR505_03135 [Actinomycetota bacterium]
MQPLARISTSDLSRNPRKVLERIAAGERLIVCCHKKPLATLQPLDGVVVQPNGRAHDIYGWPVDGAMEEAKKLTEMQRALLVERLRLGRITFGRLSSCFEFGDLIRSVEEMAIRGLARRTDLGWEWTGRGIVLREALLQAGVSRELSVEALLARHDQIKGEAGDDAVGGKRIE